LIRFKNEISQYSQIVVGSIGSGQIFGDVDAVLKRKYSYTLVCSKMDSVVYIVDAADFISLFMSYSEQSGTMDAVNDKETTLMLSCAESLFSRWYQNYKAPNAEELDQLQKLNTYNNIKPNSNTGVKYCENIRNETMFRSRSVEKKRA
jgi:hypothetical protein